MNESLRNYIWNDFKRNNAPKYYKYFNEWANALTPIQIWYWEQRLRGRIC